MAFKRRTKRRTYRTGLFGSYKRRRKSQQSRRSTRKRTVRARSSGRRYSKRRY